MSLLKIIETGKVSNTLIILIVIVSSTLLFANQEFIIRLKMVEFMKDYGKWVGIAFLVSSGFLLLVILSYLWKGLSAIWYGWKYDKLIVDSLNTLDPDEQSALREFIFNASTVALPLTNPAVASLVNKRIIYQASSHGGMSYGEICFNYTMTSKARSMLRLPMIGLPNKDPNDLNEAEKLFINNNRPAFILKYARW
ncbi:super-infection exclusion protein B [Pedobacter borealis]|uniref:super-infection exclusion protein B n=1 Tax=Pedobacter borealis TaxID=475254 RepID=UPI00049399A6|nr:super-infection exclusion protein B [Pedobacter borealis]